ncbi:MAG: histidine kinase [Dehalococcoidia bacterium]
MPRRLGPKLHLWFVAFLLLLGGATAGVVLLGFERSQDNASARSSEGLEDQGRQQLEFFAGAQAQVGYLQFASIASAAQQVAQVMFPIQDTAAPNTHWDPSHLTAGSGGQLYDANTARVTDVFIPNFQELSPAIEQDLRDSAVLDGLFPALLKPLPGKARADNFDAIAAYFTSVSGAVRYYPPDGFPERIEPDTPVHADPAMFGPEGNPERKTFWSAPYEDIAGRGLVMTAVTPVYDTNDQYRGTLGVDLSMAQLIDQLDAVQPTDSGFAFYIDSNGSLVQSGSTPRVAAEVERQNADLQRILQTMTWTTHGTERTTIEGREVFISYATMENVGGRLAVVAPVDELTTQAAAVADEIDGEGNRTVAATLGVMGIFFLAALASVAYFSRKLLLKPIEAIVAGTNEVGAGNLQARIRVHSEDELGDLARSFNAMTAQLDLAHQDMEARVQERTRELRALLDVSNVMSSTLDLDRLLGVILEQLKVAVDYTGASVLVVEGEQLITRESRAQGGPAPREALVDQRFSITALGPIWDAMSAAKPIIIDDAHGETPAAQSFREATGPLYDTSFAGVRSFLAVPLMSNDRVTGMLAMSQDAPGMFTDHHARLAIAIAAQAGIALENAYLLEQSQHSAALEERQRLARELHDSVSQALYGIALGARTARKRLDSDPTNLAEPLDYVLSLAEAGLTEMRALIFELRPDSIETEGLVAALGRQVAATRARYGVAVNAALADEPDVPVGTKEALYRIAQEAMHNTVKHARATNIDLSLERHNGHLHMHVADDGLGFDPAGEFPGHLGLRSMRERMVALGGTFEIWSAPGEGTRIKVTAPAGAGAK